MHHSAGETGLMYLLTSSISCGVYRSSSGLSPEVSRAKPLWENIFWATGNG